MPYIFPFHLWSFVFDEDASEKVLEKVLWQEETPFYVLFLVEETLGFKKYSFQLCFSLCQIPFELNT